MYSYKLIITCLSTEDLVLKNDFICLRDFTLSWSDINNNSLCGGVPEYVLTVTTGGIMIQLSSTSYNITGLVPNTTYGVTVTAIFQSGDATVANINVTTREESRKHRDIKYISLYVVLYVEQ